MNASARIEIYPEKPNITEGKRLCVSLFSGILGLELGLHKAGFATKLAIDIDESAKETATLNFADLDYVVGDVSDVTASFVLDRIGCRRGKIDLLSGGLPCQPFSKSGLRKGLNDHRGLLFQHYIQLLMSLKPKAFLLENVRGIVSSRNGQDFREIISEFLKTGYTLYWRVLDAANYGVPQFRQRLFIVGFRESIAFSLPQKTHKEKDDAGKGRPILVTAEDAIADLPDVGNYPPYKGKHVHLLKGIPEGLNYSYYCKERGHSTPMFKWRSKFWNFLFKMDRRRPSLTIQAYPGNNTGPFHWENRKLGINELKRLQTIPDWFEMKGSYLTKHRHIGNAVPPLLAYKIGLEISKALDARILLTKSEYLKLAPEENKMFSINSGRRSGKGRLYATNDGKVALLASAS
jgi:DNA (cytosine-5)-methyltransferase 1